MLDGPIEYDPPLEEQVRELDRQRRQRDDVRASSRCDELFPDDELVYSELVILRTFCECEVKAERLLEEVMRRVLSDRHDSLLGAHVKGLATKLDLLAERLLKK